MMLDLMCKIVYIERRIIHRIGLERMKATDIVRSQRTRVLVVAIMTVITISLHYRGMDQTDMVARGLFRQFCYLPILLSALWFGLRGGLLNAGAIVAVVAPVMLFRGPEASVAAQEGLEYVYYFLFGAVFGYLSDRERAAQQRREELVRQVARMEHMSAIGEMAAGLAHEIRNPMGSIKGAAEIIGPELDHDHPKREFLDILLEEVERLNRVVENFLRYARPLEPQFKWLNIYDILAEVGKNLDFSAEPEALEIKLDVPETLQVTGDENLLRQVFLNLGLNAVQAMDGKGKLEIRASSYNKSTIIEFADTGPGVPPSERSRIFMPFYSLKESGTGLGLTISERIIIAHRGRIEVADNASGGAIFRVVLPGEDS